MSELYILSTDDRARARLSLQHSLYAQSSINLLKEAGVGKGMKGLEIGCGSGAMTLELARLIGDEGQLLSIDLSQDQIDYASDVTQEFDHIKFKVWDVNYLTDLNETFDFIYCRMVLHHLADAHHAIEQMKVCLNPGGVIVCEEPSIFDSTFCTPPSEAYNRFIELARTCFLSNQRDIGIAHRMELEFQSCGLYVEQHSLYQPLLRTSEQKRIYYMALDDLTPQLLEHQWSTPEEIDKLSKELHELAEARNTLSWVRMHQVIARLM